MSIAILGQIGSFHHEAAKLVSRGVEPEIIAKDTFAEVFDAVEQGEANLGLVAIENNLDGAINPVYRLFRDRSAAWIIAEVRMQIGQNLIGHQSASIDELRERGGDLTVISYRVALGQVDGWLRSRLPKAVIQDYRDTAGSVERVVREMDPNLVAVAGRFACQTYGGHLIAEDIQDEPENHTRFMLFQSQKAEVEGATHGSLILTTDHKQGALSRALNIFDRHNCDLTSLTSHPLPGDVQHYDFYIDYELPSDNKVLARDLVALGFRVKALGEYIRVLG